MISYIAIIWSSLAMVKGDIPYAYLMSHACVLNMHHNGTHCRFHNETYQQCHK